MTNPSDRPDRLGALRRRVGWHTFWITLFAVLLLAFPVARWITSLLDRTNAPMIRRDGDRIYLTASSDGPFVVTHLYVRGDASEKRTAALTPALALIDSDGTTGLSISSLVWRDIRGERTAPPGEDSIIRALYYRAEKALPREAFSQDPAAMPARK